MSIVVLSSNGQRPEMFSNQFPQGIKLGRNSEVSVMGYSGNLLGTSTDDIFNIVVQQGENDTFTIYHGNTRPGTPESEIYFLPQNVIIEDGIYNGKGGGAGSAGQELAQEIARKLNEYEYISTFRRGWTCTFATAVAPAIGGTFTIRCQRLQAPNPVDGSWVVYGGEEQAASIINNPGNSDILNPVVTPGNYTPAFFDLKSGYIGYTHIALAAAYGGFGYELDINYTGQVLDTVVSFGLVMEQNATRCKRELDQNYPAAGTAFGPTRNNDLIYDPNQSFNANVDYVMEGDSWLRVGSFAYGIVITETGNIGTIRNDVMRDGSYRENGFIEYPAAPININDSGPVLKRFAITFRFDAAVAGVPTAQFYYDNGGGGGYVLFNSISLSGMDALFRATNNLHYGVVYNRDYLNPNTEQVRVRSMSNAGGGPVGPSDPLEETSLGWMPVDPDQFDDATNALLYKTGWINICNFANLRSLLGFYTQRDTTLTSGTVGWVSEEEIVATNASAITHFSPIVITCPDLTAKGYIGAAKGGGQEAAVLAIGRIRGNNDEYAFSSDLGNEWVQLNNASELTLNSLTIILKDVTNRLYSGLAPNFVVWLKFRSDMEPFPNKEEISISNTSYLR